MHILECASGNNKKKLKTFYYPFRQFTLLNSSIVERSISYIGLFVVEVFSFDVTVDFFFLPLQQFEFLYLPVHTSLSFFIYCFLKVCFDFCLLSISIKSSPFFSSNFKLQMKTSESCSRNILHTTSIFFNVLQAFQNESFITCI